MLLSLSSFIILSLSLGRTASIKEARRSGTCGAPSPSQHFQALWLSSGRPLERLSWGSVGGESVSRVSPGRASRVVCSVPGSRGSAYLIPKYLDPSVPFWGFFSRICRAQQFMTSSYDLMAYDRNKHGCLM